MLYKYKNEVGCRDDTVPKTADMKKTLRGRVRACNNLPQPNPYILFLGVAEDCCMLSLFLAVPSCICSFWHGVIPTFYFILNNFYTCIIVYNKYKNEVGCRDDTVPKTSDTRRYCEEE